MATDVIPTRFPVERPRSPVVPNALLAVLVAVAMETMLFAGLTSAFLIGKATAGPLAWPPLDQPRLPAVVTAVNTLVLLASGVALALGQRAFRRAPASRRAHGLIRAALVLGSLFVAIQGFEWARLIGFGLTLRSSTYGSFFYLVVGTHALHAAAAIVALAWVAGRLATSPRASDLLASAGIFWYFVVLLWPVLYGLVYLS